MGPADSKERSTHRAKKSRLIPTAAMAYGNLAGSYFLTGRFEEAEKTVQAAAERKLEIPRLLVIGYNIAVLKADQEQMDRAVALARGKRRAEHWMAHEQAVALARSGRLQAARRLSNRAMDLAVQEGEARGGSELPGRTSGVGSRLRECWRRERETRWRRWQRSNGRDVEYAAALALGLSGGSSRSEALAGDLEKRFPEDTFAKFTYVPVLRGLAALGRGKPADSVEQLQIALPYELAANGLNFSSYYLGGLHSAYVRGEALMAAKRYAEAAAEFQKILDHRGIVGIDPIGVLAHLQLGRVFALSGDKARAKAAYEAFLALWKDADADIPILKQRQSRVRAAVAGKLRVAGPNPGHLTRVRSRGLEVTAVAGRA